MSKTDFNTIIELLKSEVVPAIGCTEPVAVALCTAKAKEILNETPDKISVYLSANILKNAMGVGIPGTGGMIGLPIAVALGALIGKSEYELQVLKDVSSEAVEKGKAMIDAKLIDVHLKENIDEKLYIEVKCCAGSNEAVAIIAGSHTGFVYLSKNSEILLNSINHSSAQKEEKNCIHLTLRTVYDFAMTAPIEDISFVLESANINSAAAEQSFKADFGHTFGRLLNKPAGNRIMGESIFTDILSHTSAACDARMAGALITVISNSGSGNQGIAASLPVAVFARKNGNSEEELIRALTLSHLTVIHIKQYLGRLSALCGCVIAATGSSCGIVHLMGGGYREVTYAVKNMIGNLTGMICDGAKPSCSLKVASGVATAVFSAMLAMEQKYVTSVEGIIEDDVDKSIQNLVRIGAAGMQETDCMILDIMTHKSS
ncbi:MAG: L-serine ammonia-lyase, iron-sulfur-dependent, subunit alpha [Cytophagaceae bacterium]|nr:L-serine ammonia-lyase, iron-sulfur-dependent, subunit alpha [Cytophagaceae bacterium]